MPQYTTSILEEQLKKGERLPVGWPWRILLFMIIVFGITVTIYLGMVLGYKPYLNLRIKNLDQKIADLTQVIDERQQKNLVDFYSQLVNIQNLLSSHVMASKFFDFLEKNTHQQIQYLALDLSLADKSARLDGMSTDYDVLVQQLELFRKAPGIEHVFLEDSQTRDNKTVRFNIRLLFKPDLIK